mmetsp:Transcript_667/g.1537  ORF Transcript_667/g.1537 Transcript_667/m.1537 type:complete len:256 (+) Transcript_667:97-864(+)|eukprot:CAMPEP_0194313096 /NCGR_PEP_ID=MMETSP0171-20130528/9986_1 /TAXON_ID=218684 /ORGANISM="Corethron pennatum, Strain L29A3" /LENGTH=255 /DNA_ID=CAMNT_0039067895 /DNA_START=72 /DNA_END=839 /DNA_ORIENTATION=-
MTTPAPRPSPPSPPSYPQSASDLLGAQSEHKVYWDRSHYDSTESQLEALGRSTTVYVGNLTFRTTTNQMHALFSCAGRIRRVIMGIDRYKKTPCGFAFVEYHSRTSAEVAILALSSGRVDDRPVRVELDAGFRPGRQFGRGTSGGQVRDDRRGVVDPDRTHADGKGGGEGRPAATAAAASSGEGAAGSTLAGSKWTPPPARVRPTWEPPSRGAAVTAEVGEKRERDDGEDGYGDAAMEPAPKNARFHEVDDDEED